MADKSFMAGPTSLPTTNILVPANILDLAKSDLGGGAGRGSINPTAIGIYNAQVGGGRGSVNPTAAGIHGAQVGGGRGNASSYIHSSDNIVANSDDAYNGKLQLKFQPNILDNYDTVTYHWKLFITTPGASTAGLVMDPSVQTIIAETGITDLTIDNVHVRSIATPTLESGTGSSTHVTFDITEPSGCGLIDKIFYQSISLGIGNWSTAPFYLQLNFKTRDVDESGTSNSSAGSLDSLIWLYSLKLGNVKATVTSAGTKYECEAIIYNELAQNNTYSALKQTTVLSNLHYFQDAMTELENKLNADQLLQLIGTSSIPDTFKIIVDPVIARYIITPSDSNTNSVRSNNYSTLLTKDGTFTPGTSIDKIIDACLSSTKEYQQYMINAQVPGQEGQPANTQLSQMKKFWRIYTETRPVAYDVRRTDNAREFTIYIYEYDIGILDQNSGQTSNAPYTKDALMRRLSTYLKKSILKKKYNYIFTGTNDQIIDFDLDMNCAFAIAKARLAGIYSNSAMADKGQVTQNNSTEEREISEKLSNAIKFMNTSTSTAAGREKQSVETRASIAASSLTPDTKNLYIKLLEGSKPENRTNFLTQAVQSGGLTTAGEFSKKTFTATNLATSTTGSPYSFISDVNINGDTSIASYKQFLEFNKGKLRPTVFVESIQDKSVGLGLESNSDSGIQKLSSMFSVALHGAYGGSLQKIKMTIKGDPFWLFPYPINNTNTQLFNSLKSPEEAFQWIKSTHLTNDSVNLAGTDNFLLLRFRTPRYYNLDVNENEDSLVDSDTFSGIYKVITIASRFHNGKFEQDVEAILDPELKLSDFSAEIENDAKQLDIPTNANDLLKGSGIKAITKEPRVASPVIMGGVDAGENRHFATGGSLSVAAAIDTTAAEAQRLSNIPVKNTSLLVRLSGLPPSYI